MPTPEEPKPPAAEKSIAQQFGVFAIVVSAFLGSSLAGVALGWALWEYAGFPRWIMILTTGLGLVSATLQVLRLQKRFFP